MDQNRSLKRNKVIKKTFLDLDSNAAYSGAANVYKEAKKQDKNITEADVGEFLQGERTYTLHKPIRTTRYKRLAYIPSGLNSDWQADLADFQKIKGKNGGMAYLLVCIDVLSRKIYAEPIKSKSPKDVKPAFNKIFTRAKEKPHRLTTDRGLEFEAKTMKLFFETEGIEKRVIYADDIHAGVVERANRTIKDRLWRYFTQNETDKWVDVIQEIVEAINNSINRTLKVTPNSINRKNAQKIYERVFKPHIGTPNKQEKSRTAKPLVTSRRDLLSEGRTEIKEGDYVHMSKDKGKFGKGYTKNYTEEVFRVEKVKNTSPKHYKLVDLKGEEILGTFYRENLAKTALEPNARISEVLEERTTRKGGKEYRVRWIGENTPPVWIKEDSDRFRLV